MTAGTRRLVLLAVGSPARGAARSLGNRAKLTLSTNPHGSLAALLDDVAAAAADAVIADAGGPSWDAEAFAALREAARGELGERTVAVLAELERTLAAWQRVSARLDAADGSPAHADLRAQLGELVYPGFVTATGAARLPGITRYLRGMELRLDKLPGRRARDADWMRQVHEVTEAAEELPPGEVRERVRWMIEELRISLFAQELRTAHPVSSQRILRAIDELR
jgi:ATP-dependent helicase HrpA